MRRVLQILGRLLERRQVFALRELPDFGNRRFDAAHVADRKLLTVFYNQRATFNRLRDMAHEDRELIQDINEQSVAHSRLSAERREEYLRLISSVNRKLSIESAPNQVTFVFADGNVGLSLWCEWFKGIAYL